MSYQYDITQLIRDRENDLSSFFPKPTAVILANINNVTNYNNAIINKSVEGLFNALESYDFSSNPECLLTIKSVFDKNVLNDVFHLYHSKIDCKIIYECLYTYRVSQHEKIENKYLINTNTTNIDEFLDLIYKYYGEAPFNYVYDKYDKYPLVVTLLKCPKLTNKLMTLKNLDLKNIEYAIVNPSVIEYMKNNYPEILAFELSKRDSNNNTFFLKCYNSLTILQELQKFNLININDMDCLNNNIFHILAKNDVYDDNILSLLMSVEGAYNNINNINKYGLQPIHIYFSKNITSNSMFHEKYFNNLLKYGFDINSQNLFGMTPLHYSFIFKNYSNINYLIKSGKVNYNLVDNNNNSYVVYFLNYYYLNSDDEFTNDTTIDDTLDDTLDVEDYLYFPNDNGSSIYYMLNNPSINKEKISKFDLLNKPSTSTYTSTSTNINKTTQFSDLSYTGLDIKCLDDSDSKELSTTYNYLLYENALYDFFNNTNLNISCNNNYILHKVIKNLDFKLMDIINKHPLFEKLNSIDVVENLLNSLTISPTNKKIYDTNYKQFAFYKYALNVLSTSTSTSTSTDSTSTDNTTITTTTTHNMSNTTNTTNDHKSYFWYF